MPFLTVIAGPNGSGKSSVISALQYEGRENLLDPDAIARAMNPQNPLSAGISAGREVIQRSHEYLVSGRSLAVETTLSGNGVLELMRKARQRGFRVRLIYICLENSELNIRRVRERAARGGHDVPNADIRRRYMRSLKNLHAALKLAHDAKVYDNSAAIPTEVMEVRDEIPYRSKDEPEWLKNALAEVRSDR